MIQFGLDVQLNVDTSRGSLAGAAYVWFDTLTQALTSAERAELAGLPAATRINPFSESAQGKPGELYGLIEVQRSIDGAYPSTERRHLSHEGLAWLRGELADLPEKAGVWIGRFCKEGFLGGQLVKAAAWPVRDAPGWLVLDAQVPADQFTDPDSGRAEQQRWLGAIRQAADRLDPSFGHIEYWRDKGNTALEVWSPAGPGRRAHLAIPQTRERLRGYSWLTIASQEVAEKLGGVAALAATGAFAEVDQLAEGGVWLLATEDFKAYGMQSAEAVFQALAPALPAGMPRERNNFDGRPTFVVPADPSQGR